MTLPSRTRFRERAHEVANRRKRAHSVASESMQAVHDSDDDRGVLCRCTAVFGAARNNQ